jgi:hypothetical protein
MKRIAMKRSWIVASVAFALLAAVWHFGLGRRWTVRLSRNASFATKYVGTQTNADGVTGVVPNEDALSRYDRTIRVVDAAEWPQSVVVLDSYRARDTQTGAVLFEYLTHERVDPRTGAFSNGPHEGDIVVFPRNVEKRSYTMRSNYLAGVPLAYSGEGDVGGLNTYVFSYRGPLDLTAAFAGTAQYPGVAIQAGQEIRCADDQFYYRVWVDPLTGEQAKVEEGCLSGDYIYDKVSGRKLAAVDRWNGETSGADLAARVTEVYDARRTYAWASLYIPGILAAACAACIGAGFWRRDVSVPA